MSGKRAAIWIMFMATCGWFARTADAYGMRTVLALMAGYLCFVWYVADSDERGFHRPRWLGMAMVLCMPAAVPYYLMRSRVGAPRLRALGAYAGCLLLCVLSGWMGALLRAAA